MKGLSLHFIRLGTLPCVSRLTLSGCGRVRMADWSAGQLGSYSDAAVICVAKNTFSLLENGNAHHAAVTRPVQVFPDGVTEVALGVEHLAASGNTTCFSKGGLLQCWSENNSGEVGNGDESLGRVIQGRANVAF